MKVDVYESKRGKALRLRNDDNCYLLVFQRSNILQAWLSRAQQVEKSSHVDASDEQLTMIPEQILNNEGRIQVLNLRRNSLISRPPSEKSMTPLGYIDDLYRVHSLQVVDLSANQILTFPVQLTLLSQLTQLNLSSNYISSVPKECGDMRRLRYLNLSNNQLDALPDSLSECHGLQSLDISFNQFSQVPNCLFHLALDGWKLAGNNIEKVEQVGDVPVEIVDLRRNILFTSFRMDLENITHLDLRDNSMVSTVHLTNLRFLKVVHCERLQLTSLHLSGDNLTHVYADHNLLDSLVVMPLPEHLQTLSLSFNHFRNLPEWICDCPNLTFLRVNNNNLVKLPERIFSSQSIRSIFAFVNSIEKLPESLEENCLETLILYKNRISSLPKFFFNFMPSVNGRFEIDDDEYSRIREAHGFVDEDNRINGVISSSRQIGHFSTFPVVLPTHVYKNIHLSEQIEGLIVANSAVWSTLEMDDLKTAFHNNRSPIVIAKKIQDQLQSYDYGGNSNILVLRKMKPQMTFNDFNGSSSRGESAMSELMAGPSDRKPLYFSSMMSTPGTSGTSSGYRSMKEPSERGAEKEIHPRIDEELVLALPAMILPDFHPSPPVPASRHRTPSPPPPPLPLSTPPAESSEHEEINIHSSTNTTGYTLSINRIYSSTNTVSTSRRHFNETRDLLSKSLKLSPPSNVTFNI
uniref:PPM-type phosphatase domain-containing protein n=1 Tax=Caenorhabditis japonica TaxID=281687 RepID=A0A8R1DPN9_CAEJA